uniref:Uncharacterized protein n=1 Tax=Labrus bergylta TaxID=56723 RepID=A0A3Q3EGD0_9LABR
MFGIETPTSVELTGLRKYFNSYTLQGRRNVNHALHIHACAILQQTWTMLPRARITELFCPSECS